MRISVQGLKEGAFRVERKESSLGRWMGAEEGLKRGLDGWERSCPVLIARRWVEVARPPSEVGWVISWE